MRQFFVAFAVAVSLLTFGNPAKAQYTTKSSSTQSAAKPAAQQQARPAAAPSRATAAQTRSNLYRPRNQPVQDTGEEDLPSFEAMDAKGGGDKAAQEGASEQPASTGGNAYFNMVQQRKAMEAAQAQGSNQGSEQGSAQGSAQGSLQAAPPVMPKGEVWFYITDFSTDKVRRFTICNYKRVLQNRTDTEIDRLVLELEWAGKKLTQEYKKVKPKENVVTVSASYQDNCEVIRARPKMTVKTCRIGAAVNEACEKLVIQK